MRYLAHTHTSRRTHSFTLSLADLPLINRTSIVLMYNVIKVRKFMNMRERERESGCTSK